MRRAPSEYVQALPLAEGPRTSSWTELPTVARSYVTTVSVVGLALVAWSVPVVAQPDHALFGVLVFLSIATSLVKVHLRGTASTLSMSDVLGYLALFALGTRPAVLVIAVGAWSQCTFRTTRPTPVHQTLFSIATVALAMQLSGTIYLSLGGRSGGWDPSTALVPFATAAALFFLLNTGLVAGAVGLASAQPLGQLWCETFLSTWPAYLLGAAVSAASVFAIEREGPWLVLFPTVAFAVAFHNLRAYLERVDEATTDLLTLLPNRRFALTHAARELARARRHGTGLTLIVGDLDQLKLVNDTYGHRGGDLALRHVAQCLQRCLRSYDVCARYGGDEFLAVLSDCNMAQGEAKALELQAAVAALEVEVRPDVRTRLSVSVGTATYPDDDGPLEQLIETADARMYVDKVRRSSPGERRGAVRPRDVVLVPEALPFPRGE